MAGGKPKGKLGSKLGKSELSLMEERASRSEKMKTKKANGKKEAQVDEDGGLLSLRGNQQPGTPAQRPAQRKKDDGGEAAEKYKRGDRNSINTIKDKKLRMEIRRSENLAKEAAARAARAEILLPSEAGFLEAEGMEKTYKFKQQAIKEAVDVGSAKKIFTLHLDQLGPYNSRYSRNGRYLLLGGKRGHLALADWMSGTLKTEVHVKETVRDISFLHNETMFAAAQKKYVYIYDNQGLEVHCMRSHIEVNRMVFLPYHFLLATVGNAGFLKYQDTSTGELVVELRTKLGRCDCMALNPYNAVVNLGHSNGTVTMWTPSMSAPVVSIFSHRGPVSAIATDNQGRYMATAGLDGQLNVWDLRTYKKLHGYYTPTPACFLDISQKGLLSVAFGTHVEVWKDALQTKAQSPYLSHHNSGMLVRDVHFCPYEDVLGVGHASGFSSILVPGSGEPNFDSNEANPFQSKKQRREAEVHSLLDKLQPDMISLNPHFIAKVDTASKDVIAEERRLLREEHMTDRQRKKREKRHMRGRDKIGKKQKKRQQNVVEERKEDARKHMHAEGVPGTKKGASKAAGVLDRFRVRD